MMVERSINHVSTLRRDNISDTGVVIDSVHDKVHSGDTYSVTHIFEGVADDANADILFRVGSSVPHVEFAASAGGDNYRYIYEAPTTSANGTTKSCINRNRMSSNSSTVLCFHTPTVSAVGSELDAEYIPGGTGPQSEGGGGGSRHEWDLKVNTDYLFRVTNKSGQPKTIYIELVWYE